MDQVELLRKKIDRIKKAQEEAETLLEVKSRELYELNQALEARVKERTAELEVARDQAINASKAKSQFLANMSHEIRTPLNGMLGFVSLLLKSDLSDVQRQQLGTVSQSGHLLLSIISDILEFSKIEAGKLEIDESDFNLESCIEEIMDVMANQVFEKGLDFSTFIDESLPIKVIGDEARTRQLLVNLIGNAVKFTPSGEISVRVEPVSRKNGVVQARFTVADTGVGIAPDKLETIFTPFEQADVSDTRKYGGTGLGLTICRQIVAAMGGKIWVESEETVGSKFIFEIPLNVVDESICEMNARFEDQTEVAILAISRSISKNLCYRVTEMGGKAVAIADGAIEDFTGTKLVVDQNSVNDEVIGKINTYLENKENWVIVLATPIEIEKVYAQFGKNSVEVLTKPVRKGKFKEALLKAQEVVASNADATEKSVGGQRLLIVEDNLINQQVALATLESYGYAADVANNGQEAVEMVEKNEYSLILMDCQMPVMDGFDATKLIRKTYVDLPIIAMTANAFKKTKEECFEVGMNDFITKPVDGDLLDEVIRRHLAKAKGG